MLTRHIAAFIFALTLPSASALAQDKSAEQPGDADELGFRALTDEPSRAYLFQFVRSAAENDEPLQGNEARSLALNGPFSFPDDVMIDRVENKPRPNSIFGIDISHYEGPNFKFETLRQQGVRFVYVKATQGANYKDNLFPKYWATLDALPQDKSVLRGAYHFLSAGVDGAVQADSFLKLIGKNGGFKETDMPAVLDLEWDIPPGGTPDNDRWKGHSADDIIGTALAWLRGVEAATHKAPIVYTSRQFWIDRNISEANVDKIAPRYKIWIANYSKSARAREVPTKINNVQETLWQFSETARISTGYDKDVDANVFKGTEAEFVAAFQPPSHQ